MEQPIQNLMKTTMESIKSMIDVDTVIGSPVETADGTAIIPISKVSFAFASGGGEFGNPEKTDSNSDSSSDSQSFAGGSGAGVSVQPVGFLIVANGQFRILPVNHDSVLHRVIDYIPDLINTITSSSSNKTKKSDSLQ